jgi:hypothetical protein
MLGSAASAAALAGRGAARGSGGVLAPPEAVTEGELPRDSGGVGVAVPVGVADEVGGGEGGGVALLEGELLGVTLVLVLGVPVAGGVALLVGEPSLVAKVRLPPPALCCLAMRRCRMRKRSTVSRISPCLRALAASS